MKEILLKLAYAVARHSFAPHQTYRKIIQSLPISERIVDNFLLKQKKYFIVSTGRTGTVWLSKILDKNPSVSSVHEPVLQEAVAHKNACYNRKEADDYIALFKKKQLFLQVPSSPQIKTYVEVNGNLRRHIEPIKKYIPKSKVIHIVRDAKDVVRSIAAREPFSRKNPVYHNFAPPKVDEYSRNWKSLSDFQKYCWLWAWENKYMRIRTDAYALFEDITSSYESFKNQILQPFKINIPKKIWQKSIARTENKTQQHKMPGWDDWADERKEQLIEICGDEMSHYGYN